MGESAGLRKYYEFEDLVFDLFVRIGVTDIKRNYKYKNSNNIENEIDFLVNDSINDTKIAVEVKYYRPRTKPSNKVLESAAKTLESHILFNGCSRGMLIVSSGLHVHDKINLQDKINLNNLNNNKITIWDLTDLLEKARPYPDLLKKFYTFLELDLNSLTLGVINTFSDRIVEGQELLLKFHKIPAGREGASNFESWCIDVLKYLFGEYLTGWHEQSETIDGLNRRDLVCRVISESKSEIWELIKDTLKSRYVVFEFKNYTEKISQREIITTERYLYPTALRNCAVIISRQGASNNAKSVIQGAMREHGKLIISLDYDDISKMLMGKDNGDDPNVYLFEKVDEFLIGLGR